MVEQKTRQDTLQQNQTGQAGYAGAPTSDQMTQGLQFKKVGENYPKEQLGTTTTTTTEEPVTTTTAPPPAQKQEVQETIIERAEIPASQKDKGISPSVIPDSSTPMTASQKIEGGDVKEEKFVTTATGVGSGSSTTAPTSKPIESTKPTFLTYTGMKYDVPCYIFSWSDDLHIEIPESAKKNIHSSGHSSVVNEPVYAHKGRHLPNRKKRQRWIFTRDGYIYSEYNPDMALSCYNNTVVVQRRGLSQQGTTTTTGATAGSGRTFTTAGTEATTGTNLGTGGTMHGTTATTAVAGTGAGIDCQQWVLKPSTDANYFYICCANNPNLAIDIDKGGELIHKGYPLAMRTLGNMTTAWGYDPK